MLPALLTLVTSQQHYRETAQLKTILPNGAIVFCENRPAPYISVQLILSNRDTLDQPSSYGYRHLIEHIAARSIKGHDFEIESAGGFLFASTSRDWMRFEWRIPPEKLGLAFAGIDQLLRDCGVNESTIKREAIAIDHEVSLSTTADLASRTAWKEVYGEQGIDPLGSRESVLTAKPEDLKTIWNTMTRAGNVVISACGPLDQKQFTTSSQFILSSLVTSKPTPFPNRAIDGSFGAQNTVAVIVPPISTKKSADALVAAFGLAGRLNRPFVTYTFCDRPGLALVGSSDPFQSVKAVTDVEDPAVIFEIGRLNALRWLQVKNSTPEGAAELNGTLLSLSPSMRPSKLAENLQLASYKDFLGYWNQIKGVAK